MNYQTANEKLVGRNKDSKKLANNTYLVRNGEDIAIRLHSTNVVTYKQDGSIVLNSGGWKTSTTKDRINNYSPIRIWQHRGIWSFNHSGHDYIFEDNCVIKGNKVVGASKPEKAKKIIKFNNQINKYCTDFVNALFEGKVKEPSNGCCWMCLMKEVETGKPLGEISGNQDHILSHIKEKYYVPSLLMNAIEAYPISPIAKSVLGGLWGKCEKMQGNSWDSIAKDQIKKSIRRYVKRQLNMVS